MPRLLIEDNILASDHNLWINIDKYGNQSTDALIVAKDRVGKSGGTVLFQINEDGTVFGGLDQLEVVTTTNVLTRAESGKILVLNSATAFVTTLPAVEAGLRFVFIAGATQVTGGNHTIVPNASDDDTIYGEYLVAGATIPASAEGSINWVADTILPGDRVVVECDGTNWYVSGAAAATGAITFTT
jgi:hypothetical protein